jgi:glycosyltransferase involved in cell wall biosynthesis
MPIFVAEVGNLVAARAFAGTPLVALETDAPLEQVPAVVRRAADLGDSFDLDRWRCAQTQPGAQGTIIWFPGERLICGECSSIRRDLHLDGRRTFVPVHLPCTEDVDLVGLQPRWYAGNVREDRINPRVRIAAQPEPEPALRDFFECDSAPWARLCRALLRGCANPEEGLALLEEFRSLPGLHQTLAALALRNQVALLLRQEDFSEAGHMLERGIAAYPGYADLHYLAALVSVAESDPGRAIRHLHQATRRSDPRLVGSGGESSYRAHWLVARLSEGSGNEEVAFHHYRSGLYTRPVFEPAVVALLKHRFPIGEMKLLAHELAGLARREPKYLEPVAYYLLLHGQFEIVRRMLETHRIDAETRARLSERLAAFTAPPRRKAGPAGRPGVCLVGPLFVNSSLARINRELGAALMSWREVQVCLEPHGFGACPHGEFARAKLLEAGLMRRLPAIGLTIRHHWPPNFRRPDRGKLAVILPWEYGAAPRRWIEGIRENVDELWVPSAFVRQVLVEGGAPAGRIHVIPNGVDTAVFRPDGPRWRPVSARGFVFLFVGGAIRRKGIDLLVEAYGRAFSAHDDVSLIIKEIGSSSFYRHSSLVGKLRRAAGRRGGPHMEILSEEMRDEDLAALYRGADAFVLPYRAEGFAMPVAEAMACGKPVIVTAAGPALEFVPAELGYWVTARRVPVPEPPPPLGELAGAFTWFEPDVEQLAVRLREVYENWVEAARRGAAGVNGIRESLSWERVCHAYGDRVAALVGCDEPAATDTAPAFSMEVQ